MQDLAPDSDSFIKLVDINLLLTKDQTSAGFIGIYLYDFRDNLGFVLRRIVTNLDTDVLQSVGSSVFVIIYQVDVLAVG
jgi:hypothetical protein